MQIFISWFFPIIEIASSERGNTAKDSGYGRERSVERIMLAKANPDIAHSAVDEMGHPNRSKLT